MKIVSPRGVLALLLAVNILNYVDRQVVYALLPLLQRDLSLSDLQAGVNAGIRTALVRNPDHFKEETQRFCEEHALPVFASLAEALEQAL